MSGLAGAGRDADRAAASIAPPVRTTDRTSSSARCAVPNISWGLQHLLLHGVGGELEAGRLGRGMPVVGRGLARGRGDVQQHRADVDRRQPVDHRVVDLGDDREPVVGEPLDQVDLPERPGPVELARHEAADELAQLRVRAGSGQGGAADVVVELEARVVDPHRQPEVPGTSRIFCRYRGTPASRSPISATKRSGSKPGVSSKVMRPPTCIGVVDSSMKRNDASSGDSRSAMTTSRCADLPCRSSRADA